jgi:hypothetical protein
MMKTSKKRSHSTRSKQRAPSAVRKQPDRKYGVTPADREYEIRRRFGAQALTRVSELLAGVTAPTEQLLGAILFLARDVDELPELVAQANSDPQGVLNAAVVKEERG